ncbi:hypothetical protein EDD22DRAFT_775518 [Suillus occidentalis]|nr:hypothetical protein EDD22DRAFT_775518 [Suillus occidentalis]
MSVLNSARRHAESLSLQHNHNLNQYIMQKLQTVLIQHHHYTTLFCCAHKVLAQQPPDSSLSIHFLADPSHNQQHYNLLTVSEIAAIISRDVIHVTDSCDIMLH